MRIATAACCLAVAGGHLTSLARAQAAPPKAPAAVAQAAPAATVLGPVEQHHVPLVQDATVIDVVVASKPLREADMTAIVVVRCSADGVLCLQINVRNMLLTGKTTDNVQLRDGDLLLFPNARIVASAKNGLDLIDSVVRDAKAEHWPSAQRARFAAWRLLSEPDAGRRHDYVSEFGKLAADGAVALAPLTQALGGDVTLARDAATALGMLGAAARPALPELKKHAEGPDAQLAARCKAAMRAIESAAK